MKVRAGFVSNSSSSSFIVAKEVIGEEKWDKFVALLEKLDLYYESSDHYIMVDTSDQGFEDDEDYAKIGFKRSDYLSVYN